MPIVGSKLVVREAGWSSNSNREDKPKNRSAARSTELIERDRQLKPGGTLFLKF
jgi:hypothetical protein